MGVAAAAAATTPKSDPPTLSGNVQSRGSSSELTRYQLSFVRSLFPQEVRATEQGLGREIETETDKQRQTDSQKGREGRDPKRERNTRRRMSENSLLELLLGAKISIRFTVCLRCCCFSALFSFHTLFKFGFGFGLGSVFCSVLF